MFASLCKLFNNKIKKIKKITLNDLINITILKLLFKKKYFKESNSLKILSKNFYKKLYENIKYIQYHLNLPVINSLIKILITEISDK